jgi:hypothetical protein
MSRDFTIHVPLEAFEKGDDPDGHTMWIGGVVSTESLDQEDEVIIQQGLDFNPFLDKGWFNDNHSKETTGIVGYPSDAQYVQKGQQLPNGKRSRTNGWWAEGYLLNTAKGREIFGLCRALEDTPRQLGFSIEGKVKQRDPRNKKRITKGVVRNIAVTHCPVNTDTEMYALAKALTAGASISNPGTSPGEGFPLRGESLEGSPDHPKRKSREAPAFSQEGSDKNAWEAGAKEEQDPDETENLSGAMGDDPNDGGWAGTNPHTTPIRTTSEGLPPNKISKAVDRDFEVGAAPISEVDLVSSWKWPDFDPSNYRDDRLTKSEARVMVAKAIPNLSAEEVDAFIDNLSE